MPFSCAQPSSCVSHSLKYFVASVHIGLPQIQSSPRASTVERACVLQLWKLVLRFWRSRARSTTVRCHHNCPKSAFASCPIAYYSYQAAVNLDPKQQDYWNNKGNSERALGDLIAAERSLRRGLQLPPEQVSLLLNLAQVLQDRGEQTEVRMLAERAVKVHPSVS